MRTFTHSTCHCFSSRQDCFSSTRPVNPAKNSSPPKRTIVYPYVVWTILFALSQAALVGHTNREVNLSEVLRTFLWRPYAHFWFLYALMLTLVPLFYLAKLPQRSTFILFAAITVQLAEIRGLLGNWPPLLEAGHYFIYIAGGAVLSDLIFHWTPRLSSTAWLLIAATAGYTALALLLRTAPKAAGLHAVTGISATIALAMLLARTVAANSFSFLGQKSLVIYVAHVIPAAAMRIVLQRLLGIHSLMLHLALGTAVGIAIPLLLEQLALLCHFPFLFSWPGRPPRPAPTPSVPRPTLRAA